MLGYVTIGANDAETAHRFYDAVLGTLGWKAHMTFGEWRGYSLDGKGEGQSVWVCKPFDGAPATVGNGMMVAFTARDHAQVDAFHAAAMANGGADEGEPGPRPADSTTFYGAYVRDPTGNKIAIFTKPSA